jgi:hypothetical protein
VDVVQVRDFLGILKLYSVREYKRGIVVNGVVQLIAVDTVCYGNVESGARPITQEAGHLLFYIVYKGMLLSFFARLQKNRIFCLVQVVVLLNTRSGRSGIA